MKINRRQIFFILIPFLIVGFIFGLNQYYVSEYESLQIDKYNELAEKLDEELIETQEVSSNPIGIVNNYNLLLETRKKTEQIATLELKISEIEETFDAEVEEYNLQVSREITHISLDNILPGPDEIENLNFEIKKSGSEDYLSEIKKEIRSELLNYNQNNENIYWKINPKLEIENMTNKEKAGLLFSFALPGQSLSDEYRQFTNENNLSSFIYFANNIENSSQLAAFSSEIDEVSIKYPSIIATDQEGGVVKRLWWDESLSHKDISNLNEEEQCDQWINRANTLYESGINWNFGTVADVSQNLNSFIYPRTFSTEYSKAGESVGISAKCSEKNLSTLKHWPGHGSTSVDTHFNLGRLSLKNIEQWNSKDNSVFAAGIENGADSVMVGHLIFDELTGPKPATLSKQAIDYLRQDMNFNGLVVTDDMNMLTRSGYPIQDAVEQALLAGNDIILVVIDDINIQLELIQIAENLVDSEEISEEDLNLRLTRILEAKNKVLEFEGEFIDSELVY